MGRGGISTPKHSGRLRGKGAILLGVSHRPARVRFPPPPLSFDAFPQRASATRSTVSSSKFTSSSLG